MAKQKPDLSSIFSKTEEPPESEPDKTIARGIGLKSSEWDRLEAMAAELGVNRHSLAVWALRDFMERWDKGLRPETETKTILK